MYAGVSGLRTHQQMMDVTGNNIANVSTTGFKSSATVFQDTLSQTINGAAAPADGEPAFGGSNPAQIGLGVRLGGISTNLTQGSSQLTGRATDLAVQGDGYFVVQNGTEMLYTRAGSFDLDRDGNLITPSRGLVMSTENAKITINKAEYESYTISPGGVVTGVPVGGDGVPVVIATIKLATFPNPAGLEKVGGSMLRETQNSGDPEPTSGAPGIDGRGLLAVGVLEMSNVDLAQEFTNLIVAQRGLQANSRIITSSDEVLQELVNLKR
jgi:flagellar hook protein FlgE